MAADNISPAAMLNYVPLTEAVEQIRTELPRPLPQQFYTQTKQVLGNKFRRFLFRGTRRPALQAIYGSPPRQVPQTALARQDAVMIHSIEMIGAGSEVLDLMHRYNDYTVVLNAEEELDRRARDFAVRTENLRSVVIHSAVANGKVWFDANGEPLASSSGANLTVDYGVPAGNFVTASIDWSDPTQNIPAYVSTFLSQITREGYGHRPRYAICGANVQGYLAANNHFREYLARNESFNNYFINNNQIANGVLGLEWVMAQDAYFEKSDGTLVTQFPADQITFVPDLTRNIYELKEGSQPVPKQFMTAAVSMGDFSDVLKEMLNNPVYGPFRYAYGQAIPIPQVWMVQGDNFLPDFPTPQALWFLDTKP